MLEGNWRSVRSNFQSCHHRVGVGPWSKRFGRRSSALDQLMNACPLNETPNSSAIRSRSNKIPSRCCKAIDGLNNPRGPKNDPCGCVVYPQGLCSILDL